MAAYKIRVRMSLDHILDLLAIRFCFLDVLLHITLWIDHNRFIFRAEIVRGMGKSGYIDNSGKIVIRPQFDEAWRFSEGLAPIRVGDDWGYINVEGKIVIKPQFFEASRFSDGIASVGVWFPKKQVIDSKVGFYNYIDKQGRLISKDRFGVAFDFSDGLAQVLTSDYKHGVIDRVGNLKFYFDVYNSGFRDGLAMFKTNGNMRT